MKKYSDIEYKKVLSLTQSIEEFINTTLDTTKYTFEVTQFDKEVQYQSDLGGVNFPLKGDDGEKINPQFGDEKYLIEEFTLIQAHFHLGYMLGFASFEMNQSTCSCYMQLGQLNPEQRLLFKKIDLDCICEDESWEKIFSQFMKWVTVIINDDITPF
ncbi:MAG: hypothetical protein JWL92_330 [Candidatus Nomurabacteria bacterium]|nr:hypothetical protein [Candidatus Nomurabacteria bacterium]